MRSAEEIVTTKFDQAIDMLGLDRAKTFSSMNEMLSEIYRLFYEKTDSINPVTHGRERQVEYERMVLARRSITIDTSSFSRYFEAHRSGASPAPSAAAPIIPALETMEFFKNVPSVGPELDLSNVLTQEQLQRAADNLVARTGLLWTADLHGIKCEMDFPKTLVLDRGVFSNPTYVSPEDLESGFKRYLRSKGVEFPPRVHASTRAPALNADFSDIFVIFAMSNGNFSYQDAFNPERKRTHSSVPITGNPHGFLAVNATASAAASAPTVSLFRDTLPPNATLKTTSDGNLFVGFKSKTDADAYSRTLVSLGITGQSGNPKPVSQHVKNNPDFGVLLTAQNLATLGAEDVVRTALTQQGVAHTSPNLLERASAMLRKHF